MSRAKENVDAIHDYITTNAPKEIQTRFLEFMHGTASCLQWADKKILHARLLTVAIGVLYIIKCL